MKKRTGTLLLALMLCLMGLSIFAPPLAARMAIEYFQVNHLRVDASEKSLTLYRPFLSDGKIYIRSRADVGKNRLGAAYISIDGGRNWQNAAFLSNGTISYGFAAEPGRSYDVVIKAMDHRAQSNDIHRSRTRINVSDQDMHAVINRLLKAAVRAYEAENADAFMAHVSEDFTGDKMNLDSAIRRDFSLLDNIDLQISAANFAVDANGYAFMSVTYTRSVTSTRSGRSLQDKGLTEMIFTVAGPKPQIYSMKNPVLFGLSDAANVASGQVNTGRNDRILVVNDNGEAAVLPFDRAMDVIEGRGSSGFPSIPAPQHLVLESGAVRRYIELRFNLPMQVRTDAYEILVEESKASGGPWQPVKTKPLDSTVRVTSEALSKQTGPLFYRVRIKKPATGEKSLPSNVLKWQWQNG